jgi:hypothetical protein
MIPHALLASLPLILIAATIVTVHSLSRAVLLIAWAAAALCGARAAAQLFRLMLAERSGLRRAPKGVDPSALGLN